MENTIAAKPLLSAAFSSSALSRERPAGEGIPERCGKQIENILFRQSIIVAGTRRALNKECVLFVSCTPHLLRIIRKALRSYAVSFLPHITSHHRISHVIVRDCTPTERIPLKRSNDINTPASDNRHFTFFGRSLRGR